MNNNLDNFINNQQSKTPADNNQNVIREQPIINVLPPLDNSKKQLNAIAQQENNTQQSNDNNNRYINNNLNSNLNVIPNNFDSESTTQINNLNNINNNITSINNQNNISVNQDNNRFEFNDVFSDQTSSINNIKDNEEYDMLRPQQNNKFINSDFDTTSTALTDLNVDPNSPRVDYSNDPRVQANLNKNEKIKNTITITEEAKIFLIIIAVLFLFIFVMPYIFDALRYIG